MTNGIGNIISEETLNKLIVKNYFNGILPSEIQFGSFTKEASNTNIVKINTVSRDGNGNIISYNEDDKNKSLLSVPQLAFRFNTNIVKYVTNYVFDELMSSVSELEIQQMTINSLEFKLLELQASIAASKQEVIGLTNINNQQQSTINQSQILIDSLTNQALDIANKLSEEVKNTSTASSKALKAITESIKSDQDSKSKMIDDLQKEISKLKDTLINDKKTNTNDKGRDTKTVNPLNVSDKQIDGNLKIDSILNIGFTAEETKKKKADVTVGGNNSNTSQVAAIAAENKMTEAEKKAFKKKQERDDLILNNSNKLLAEIAIGSWYRFHKQEPSLYQLFERRDEQNIKKLTNTVTPNSGNIPVNQLTSKDIDYLLTIFKEYWINTPYNDIYSKGTAYSDIEQAKFELIYPLLKGVRQYNKGPAHFLYSVNIFNDKKISDKKYSYVKF